MLTRRTLTIFTATFAVVLVSGIAFAQFGVWAPRAPELAEAALASIQERSPQNATSAPTADPATHPAGEMAVESAVPAGTARAHAGPVADASGGFRITFPADGQRFTEQTVSFQGMAPAGWTVTAAGYRAELDDDGHWHIALILSPGRNAATLYATSPDGTRVETARVTVYYDLPPQTSDGAAGEGEHGAIEFTAEQKYGSRGGPHAAEHFWGTASPGAAISVTSPHGSASTTAAQKGFWDLTVTFPTAPAGETFYVVVEASSGGRAVFEFTYLGSDRRQGESRSSAGAAADPAQDHPRDNGRGQGSRGQP